MDDTSETGKVGRKEGGLARPCGLTIRVFFCVLVDEVIDARRVRFY